MTELPAYLTGLVVTALIALLTAGFHRHERAQVVRVAFAIIAVWAIGTVYVYGTGNYTPWKFSIMLDIAAAAVIMVRPASRAQALIGMLYFLQIAGHVAYGGRITFGYDASPVYYYDALTIVAWAQLFALGAWCGGIWLGTLVHGRWHRRHEVHRRARAANLAREK